MHKLRLATLQFLRPVIEAVDHNGRPVVLVLRVVKTHASTSSKRVAGDCLVRLSVLAPWLSPSTSSRYLRPPVRSWSRAAIAGQSLTHHDFTASRQIA